MNIAKTIKEELPETVDGLREYIKIAERQSRSLSKRIDAAKIILIEKLKGQRI